MRHFSAPSVRIYCFNRRRWLCKEGNRGSVDGRSRRNPSLIGHVRMRRDKAELSSFLDSSNTWIGEDSSRLSMKGDE